MARVLYLKQSIVFVSHNYFYVGRLEMIDRKDIHRTYASLINEAQENIISTVDKAIEEMQRQKSSNEFGRVLSNITKDTNRHFTSEEAYLKDFKYPEYHYHKEEHQDFSTKALAYGKIIPNSDSQTANEILDYLKKWLVRHFQETDNKSIEYFYNYSEVI